MNLLKTFEELTKEQAQTHTNLIGMGSVTLGDVVDNNQKKKLETEEKIKTFDIFIDN